VELAAEIGRAQPSRLIMAAISAVFTIGYVATLLGEDENWIFDLSISMCPEDGCLWVHGVGENGVPAFTRDGIENLRQIIADERAAGRGLDFPPGAGGFANEPRHPGREGWRRGEPDGASRGSSRRRR
jgi:hypothetical protein